MSAWVDEDISAEVGHPQTRPNVVPPRQTVLQRKAGIRDAETRDGPHGARNLKLGKERQRSRARTRSAPGEHRLLSQRRSPHPILLVASVRSSSGVPLPTEPREGDNRPSKLRLSDCACFISSVPQSCSDCEERGDAKRGRDSEIPTGGKANGRRRGNPKAYPPAARRRDCFVFLFGPDRERSPAVGDLVGKIALPSRAVRHGRRKGTMPGSKKKQAAANKPPKEKPLDTFIPTSYMALLEGTLLTNGDLKGSWRLKRDDVIQNDFCMVLMDRGVYDGGFNIQVPKAHPSAPAVQEIHDKWYSVEWAETTKSCCNVWGRGRNKEFGEFYTIGVHDPRQRRIVIYKVCEAEMRRAQAFARSNAPAVKPDPTGAVASSTSTLTLTTRAATAAAAAATAAAAAVATTSPPSTAPALPPAATAAATTPPSPATPPAAARPSSTAAATAAATATAAAAAPAAMRTRVAAFGGRQKRPRTYSRVGEITAAAALLYSAAHPGPRVSSSSSSGDGGVGSSSNFSGAGSYPTADAQRSRLNGNVGSGGGDGDGGGGGDGLGSDRICVEGSGGGPAVGEGRAPAVPARTAHAPPVPAHNVHAHKAYGHASGSTAGCRPTPVHIPAEATRTLPGFSGVFEEPSRSGVGVVDGGVDDLADLSILGARLQREKLRIQEDARAQRQPYVEQMSEFQGKLRKAKADEAMMLRAVQELRKKMMEDERQLESATQRVKSYEAEEQHALLLWNNKWETQVAPFIAQCEQGVRKKADELDKKTREAEMERRKLERELERLRSVKQIGDVFAQNLPR